MNEEDILKDENIEDDDLEIKASGVVKKGGALDDDLESADELSEEEDEEEEPFDDVNPL